MVKLTRAAEPAFRSTPVPSGRQGSSKSATVGISLIYQYLDIRSIHPWMRNVRSSRAHPRCTPPNRGHRPSRPGVPMVQGMTAMTHMRTTCCSASAQESSSGSTTVKAPGWLRRRRPLDHPVERPARHRHQGWRNRRARPAGSRARLRGRWPAVVAVDVLRPEPPALPPYRWNMGNAARAIARWPACKPCVQ